MSRGSHHCVSRDVGTFFGFLGFRVSMLHVSVAQGPNSNAAYYHLPRSMKIAAILKYIKESLASTVGFL